MGLERFKTNRTNAYPSQKKKKINFKMPSACPGGLLVAAEGCAAGAGREGEDWICSAGIPGAISLS